MIARRMSFRGKSAYSGNSKSNEPASTCATRTTLASGSRAQSQSIAKSISRVRTQSVTLKNCPDLRNATSVAPFPSNVKSVRPFSRRPPSFAKR